MSDMFEGPQFEEPRARTVPGVLVDAQRTDRRRPGPAPEAHGSLKTVHEPAGAAAESVRALYYALRRALGGAPLGLLAVTSAARGEGRSTLAANLAFAAARETGVATALVDADLRRPALHRLVGADGEVGLSDLLANRADFDAALWEHPAGVTLLAGGRPEPEPARRFTTPRFLRVLSQLRHSFAEVVVDLAPLAFADARLVAAQCDAAVLVVRAGRTDAALAREAATLLDGVRLLGAVLNDASEVDAPTLRAARLALPGR